MAEIILKRRRRKHAATISEVREVNVFAHQMPQHLFLLSVRHPAQHVSNANPSPFELMRS